MARLESTPSTSDFITLGSIFPPRSLAQVDLLLLLYGIGCLGLPPLVSDSTHLGLMSPLQGFS
eukprot:2920654-Amphidinium_carterae.1